MKKILVVAHNHPARSPGGGEIVAYDMYKEVCRTLGFDGYFLAASPKRPNATSLGMIHRLASDGKEYSIHVPEYDPFLLMALLTPERVEELENFLKAYRFDVVHIHHLFNIGVDFIRIVRNALPDAKICMTFHEFLFICARDGQMIKLEDNKLCDAPNPVICSDCVSGATAELMFLREEYIRQTFGLVDHFFAPSMFLLNRYVSWGIDKSRISYVANSYSSDSASAVSPLPPRQNVFGFFGNITPFKGVEVMLEAAERLIGDGMRNFHMRIHGRFSVSEEVERHMRAKIDRLGEHVSYLGQYKSRQISKLMAGVDWVVVPSIWWENSPLVIQEAFRHHRPVVCSDIGGMAEQVAHNVNGIHFPVGDADELANTIKSICALPDLYQELLAGIPKTRSISEYMADHLPWYLPVPSPVIQ